MYCIERMTSTSQDCDICAQKEKRNVSELAASTTTQRDDSSHVFMTLCSVIALTFMFQLFALVFKEHIRRAPTILTISSTEARIRTKAQHLVSVLLIPSRLAVILRA